MKGVLLGLLMLVTAGAFADDSVIAPPEYVCQWAETAPVIDGKLDDAVWQKARKSAPLVDIEHATRNGKYRASEYETRFQMAWDSAYLYVAAWLPEKEVWATQTQRDAIIYHDPDFEVFIDPDGDGRNYIEIEINALNTVWDLFLTAPYGDPLCVALHDWNIPKLKHAVNIQGTLNHNGDTDTGWSVEMAIPWESITGHSNLPRKGEPPAPGTVMKMNFSRVGWAVEKDADAPHGYRKKTDQNGKNLPETNDVWAPTGKVNIHMPEHWGKVYFSARPAGTWEVAPKRDSAFDVYVWVHGGDHADDVSMWESRFYAYRVDGIDAVIIDGTVDSVRMLSKLAHAKGLRAYAWVWSLNQPGNEVALSHSDWYSVNRLGKSCHAKEDRPYIAYYEFLCPNHPGVREHLAHTVKRYADIPWLAGIQLDYIRMVDVILPRGLWENYNLVQDKELPQFDYCYCELCQSKFERENGRKIAADPTTDTAWREFRLRSVAEAAAVMAETAHDLRLPCVAAVFPSPSVASKLVRQDWSRFPIELALPMDYNSFYNEPDSWIGRMMRQANDEIDRRFPIAPGIHLPDISPEKLPVILDDIFNNGGSGVGLFSHETLTPERRDALRTWKQKRLGRVLKKGV